MIDQEKKILRDQYRALRRELPAEEKEASDAAIAAQFLNSEYYRRCSSLFMYVSLPAEVDTGRILQVALRDGKTVAAPVCCPEDHSMTFYRIGGEEDLLPGSYGIREPDASCCAAVLPDEMSLCLVPGFTFTPGGLRLGYGGGYYDRFLASFPGVSVGLCRGKWLAAALPADRFDRPVQVVATEDRILLPNGGF